MRATLRNQLCALPVLALALAATDTLLVRLELEHRPTSPALFVEATLLWACFGMVALLPAGFTARWLRRREPRPARDALVLLAWMALPVVLHARLDRYTNLGADVSRLASLRPWLEAGLAIGLCAAGLWLAARATRRRPGAVALGATGLALVVGLLLPPRFSLPTDAPAGTAAAERPNLLLVVWDTTRAPSLALYGYDRETTPATARAASSAPGCCARRPRSASASRCGTTRSTRSCATRTRGR
jgi:hypothetical protein